jgi:hypothetical protein
MHEKIASFLRKVAFSHVEQQSILLRAEREDGYTMGDTSYFLVRWFGESDRLFTVSNCTTM